MSINDFMALKFLSQKGCFRGIFLKKAITILGISWLLLQKSIENLKNLVLMIFTA